MIKARNSNNEYVNIEDIKCIKLGETKDIEYVKDNLGNVLYSKYKEIETENLPVNFISKNNTLKNYRIYGNTVNGDSVGDSTKNLFDFKKWSANVTANAGNDIIKNIDSITLIANTNDAFTTPYVYTHTDLYKINVKPNTTYVLSWSSNNNLSGKVFVFKNGMADGSHMINVNNSNKKYLLFDTDMDTEFVSLRFGVANAEDSITYSKIMLVEGDAVLPYEPYGYRLPLTVEGKNLANIYTDIIPMSFTGITSGNPWVKLDNPSQVQTKGFYLKCMPNTTYTLSRKTVSNNRFSIGFSENIPTLSGVRLLSFTMPLDSSALSLTATSPQNANYICCYLSNQGDNITEALELMLEKNTIVTPYEPYHTPVTTNLYLPEQIRKVGDEVEFIDYKKQKLYKVRKNLFDFSSWADSLVYTTRISYNITGNMITLNATSNDAFTSPYSRATGGFEIQVNPNTTYILSWQSDNNNSGQVYVFENGVLSSNQMHNVDNSSKKSMRFTTLPDTRFLTFRLGVSNIGDSIAYFNIQLELGSVITPYEPYIQNTELDVTLPNLPTTAGTNNLSVGTTVQPSKVYLKGKITEIN